MKKHYNYLKSRLYQQINYDNFLKYASIVKVKYSSENIRIVFLDDGTYLVFEIQGKNIIILSVQ